eukprot:sb/3473837/
MPKTNRKRERERERERKREGQRCQFDNKSGHLSGHLSSQLISVSFWHNRITYYICQMYVRKNMKNQITKYISVQFIIPPYQSMRKFHKSVPDFRYSHPLPKDPMACFHRQYLSEHRTPTPKDQSKLSTHTRNRPKQVNNQSKLVI